MGQTTPPDIPPNSLFQAGSPPLQCLGTVPGFVGATNTRAYEQERVKAAPSTVSASCAHPSTEVTAMRCVSYFLGGLGFHTCSLCVTCRIAFYSLSLSSLSLSLARSLAQLFSTPMSVPCRTLTVELLRGGRGTGRRSERLLDLVQVAAKAGLVDENAEAR